MVILGQFVYRMRLPALQWLFWAISVHDKAASFTTILSLWTLNILEETRIIQYIKVLFDYLTDARGVLLLWQLFLYCCEHQCYQLCINHTCSQFWCRTVQWQPTLQLNIRNRQWTFDCDCPVQVRTMTFLTYIFLSSLPFFTPRRSIGAPLLLEKNKTHTKECALAV